MSQRRCAQLAAWGSAWLQGYVAFDEVLDAVAEAPRAGAERPQRQVAGPGFEAGTLHPVSAALTDWKRAGSLVLRLALPVPGDVRGLAGETQFRSAALQAGQAVFGVGFGITVLPGRPTPSSAGVEVCWHRSTVGDAALDYLAVAEAEHDLTEAIRETASELGRRGSSSWLGDVSPKLVDARRAGERLNLPGSHPPRAVRLIAQAERLSAVLQVADSNPTGELTVAGMGERAAALAPLRIAVRRALLAGYNAAAGSDAAEITDPLQR